MTERENLQRARKYLEQLARGMDPLTGLELPEDSSLNDVRLVRCFLYVSDILERVVANGGTIGGKPKALPFVLSQEQLARIQISHEPIRVTQFVERISAATDNTQMKKLKTTVITDWLLEKGFLKLQKGTDGKNTRIPTQSGREIGLFTQIRQGKYGEYQAVFYDSQAQQFVLDHLFDMLEKQ